MRPSTLSTFLRGALCAVLLVQSARLLPGFLSLSDRAPYGLDAQRAENRAAFEAEQARIAAEQEGDRVFELPDQDL